MKAKITPVIILGILMSVYAKAVSAVCPICTVAVAGGVGLSRWLGVDDAIIGLWVGGLTVSFIFWTFDWFERKNWTFKYYKTVIILSYYILVVVPLYFTKILGQPLKAFDNFDFIKIDKLILSTLTGSAVFWAAANWHFWLKAKNDNKVYFPFQKVVFPVSSLILVSLIFYWIIKL